MGLHHGLCHVLGGTAGVPHGIANSIILPHAIRFNAPTCADLLTPAAQAFGISTAVLEPLEVVNLLVQKIALLAGQMGLPYRLRDAGVSQEDLPQLARLAFQNKTVQVSWSGMEM